MDTDQIQFIDMGLIDRPVKISREVIDPERVRELAESIREVGLLQPVVLRSVNGRYEMVAGDRRYLAHKLLGLKEIKAVVRDLDDRETVVIRGIENLQRENLTPSEEGRVYMLLHDEGGLTYKQIAAKVGKHENTILRYVRVPKLPEEVRRAVDMRVLSLEALEVLLEIEDEDAFMFYFNNAAVNGITKKVLGCLWMTMRKRGGGLIIAKVGAV